MSSISSSDRTRQDEKIRQTREEYENRESDAAKRREAEIKRLENTHNEELRKITETYENQLAEIKERNRETLNGRDFENNRKIEKVRQTYRESLRNKMEDAYANREEQRRSYEAALQKQKQLGESQHNNTLGQMKNEVTSRDELVSQINEQTRIRSQDATQKTTRRLNEVHEKEKNALIMDNEEDRQSLQRGQNEMRKAYEARLKQSERNREADNSRWSQKYADVVINKTEEFSDSLDMKQQIMDQERASIRDKFQNKLEEKSAMMDSRNDSFRDSVNNRLNSQVRSRDSKIQSLSGKLNNEISKNGRLRGIERRSLTKAYEQRLELAGEQREDMIERMREVNGERIDKVVEYSQKLLGDTETANRAKMNEINLRNRQDRESMKTYHKDQVDYVMQSAENRVKKAVDSTNKSQERAEQYYNDSLDVVKANYMDRMDSYRDRTVSEKVANNKAITERFRGIESNFNAKLEQTVKRYENKIEQLQASQARELKRLENVYAQRTGEQGKSGKMEKDSVAMKYEARIAQLNESHQSQLDRMNRRHQEDMQNLSTKISAYSRKA